MTCASASPKSEFPYRPQHVCALKASDYTLVLNYGKPRPFRRKTGLPSTLPVGAAEEGTVEARSFTAQPIGKSELRRAQERFARHGECPTTQSCCAFQPWHRSPVCPSGGDWSA